jgi:hypothetical protein
LGVSRRAQHALEALSTSSIPPAGNVLPTPGSVPRDDRRPCPNCGQMIKAQARLCRYCRSAVDPYSGS